MCNAMDILNMKRSVMKQNSHLANSSMTNDHEQFEQNQLTADVKTVNDFRSSRIIFNLVPPPMINNQSPATCPYR